MARVTQQKPGRATATSSSTRGAQVSKQRNNKKQKVVFQSNGPDQGEASNVVSTSSKSVKRRRKGKPPAHPKQLSFHTEPPPGYTYIPAGNPQLTNALKEFAKKGNHKIYSVSVNPLSPAFRED